MLPGFITDTMGFLMLIPPVRRLAARKLIEMVKSNIKIHVGPISVHPPSDAMNEDAIETEAVKHPESPETGKDRQEG